MSANKYPVKIHGKMYQLSEEKIGQLVKHELKNNFAIQRVFEEVGVGIEQLDKMHVVITDQIGERFAETDIECMKINASLFTEEGNFFKESMFIMAHEIVHFCTRVLEDRAYLKDPEEVQGFVSSIAYELVKKTHPDEIFNKVYSKIKWHFNDENDARKFYMEIFQKARGLIS